MLKGRSIAVFLATVLFAAPLWTQAQIPTWTPVGSAGPAPTGGMPSVEPLASASAADRFWELGHELAHTESITGPQADQAIILLTAARSLKSQAPGIERLLLELMTHRAERDYSEPISLCLQGYVGASADRKVVSEAVRHLLSRLNSWEDRKVLLETLVKKIGNRNAAVDSELATLLGLLVLEKGNLEQGKFYLVQAYTNNKYNKTAFAKLGELFSKEIGPTTQLEHLRISMGENPLDLNKAIAFAGQAERLQLFDVAAASYQYCAELFVYLYPSEPLPPNLYLPWAISCYNTEQSRYLCPQIAAGIRGQNRFDVLLEAIAGRAALKIGKPEEAQQILQQAEQTAQQLLSAGAAGQSPSPEPGGVVPVRPINAKQLAWFHCFANPNPAKALDWANRAYSAEPNSPAAAALLAYALVTNNQLEWAKPLLASAEQGQITDLVNAKIQLSLGNKAQAIQSLSSALARDTSSLAAETAKDLLRELGATYTPSIDTKTLLAFLRERFGTMSAPQFLPPDKILDVQFNLRGTDFSYGHELEGVVTITNRGAEPLIITDDGLFQGNVRVDARVAGGITREIPNLVSETIRTDLAVPSGRSLVHMLRLSTGELRRILTTYPQATLQVQFTLYLDPVTTAEKGPVSNRLVDVKPATLTIMRPGVQVVDGYIRGRFNAISSGQEAQTIQTAQLFTGLLKEQQAMALQGRLYPYNCPDWMPELLRSSLLSPSGLLLGEGPNEWVIKVHTMADLLSVPIDRDLAEAVAKSLQHRQWPVRLMAVTLLARSSGNNFGRVLDWVAQNDRHELVRSMAMSLNSVSRAAPSPSLQSIFQPVTTTQP